MRASCNLHSEQQYRRTADKKRRFVARFLSGSSSVRTCYHRHNEFPCKYTPFCATRNSSPAICARRDALRLKKTIQDLSCVLYQFVDWLSFAMKCGSNDIHFLRCLNSHLAELRGVLSQCGTILVSDSNRPTIRLNILSVVPNSLYSHLSPEKNGPVFYRSNGCCGFDHDCERNYVALSTHIDTEFLDRHPGFHIDGSKRTTSPNMSLLDMYLGAFFPIPSEEYHSTYPSLLRESISNLLIVLAKAEEFYIPYYIKTTERYIYANEIYVY